MVMILERGSHTLDYTQVASQNFKCVLSNEERRTYIVNSWKRHSAVKTTWDEYAFLI
jgi:hypothetical protein